MSEQTTNRSTASGAVSGIAADTTVGTVPDTAIGTAPSTAPAPIPASGRAAPRPRPRPIPVWAVIGAAVLGAETVWTISARIIGVALDVAASGGAASGTASDGASTVTVVGPGVIAVAATAAVLLAWPVRALLSRGKRGPHQRAWRVTCAIALLISLTGPLGATSTAATLALVAMHLVVAAVVVVGLDPCRSSAARAARSSARLSAQTAARGRA